MRSRPPHSLGPRRPDATNEGAGSASSGPAHGSAAAPCDAHTANRGAPSPSADRTHGFATSTPRGGGSEGSRGVRDEGPRAAPRPYLLAAWIGASTLLFELFLIRVFDTIVGPSAAYALVGLALFGIALAGVATALRPSLLAVAPSHFALGLGTAPVLLWVVLRWVPFSVARIPEEPLGQMAAFLLLGIILIAPFFLGALAILALLARGPARKVYAADLAGSALGPWLLPGLLPHAGPAGLLAILAGLHFVAAAGWIHGSRDYRRPGVAAPGSTPTVGAGRAVLLVSALALVTLGASGRLESWDVPSHAEKRGAIETRLRAGAEFRRWDAVSKIEVVDLATAPLAPGEPRVDRKLISYDGGAQSSHIYAFDGDYAALRANLGERIPHHFWQRGVAAGAWFFRDRGARVFVAGCAGGQEVTAALLFGAREVVAVDLVGTVVELGQERYADYNGGIFRDPRVRFEQAEARSALARSEEAYDLIQIFSYHNSSRVASGALALKAFYLQTQETYRLCLERLSPDGILQIHQGFFPRVVTTLAAAWADLGGSDVDGFGSEFERHVVIYGRDGVEDHYTILVKRSPWTPAEIADLDAFLLADFPSEGRRYRRIETPTDRAASFLPDALYHAPLANSLAERAAFRIAPVTDDNPFSLFLRKGLGRTAADSLRFTTPSEAALLDEVIPQRLPLPRDTAHLVLLGIVAVLVSAAAFAVAALVAHRESRASRSRTVAPENRTATAGLPPGGRAPRGLRHGLPRALYFYLIGLGFIGVEWALVQFAFRIVALPIAAFGCALGVLLVGAALGSWHAERLRTALVFPGIVALGCVLLTVYPAIAPSLWGAPLGLRIAAFALTMLPLAVLLGMPFPRGLARQRNTRALASAWALNGAASVTGSVLTAALFATLGVGATFTLALLAYAAAGVAFHLMETVTSPAD